MVLSGAVACTPAFSRAQAQGGPSPVPRAPSSRPQGVQDPVDGRLMTVTKLKLLPQSGLHPLLSTVRSTDGA
ncbi:unnamed protein product [Boreogadus saida]